MAVRFAAQTDRYRSNVGVTGSAVTIVGWFQLVSNRATFQALCGLMNSTDATQVAFVCDSSRQMNLYDSGQNNPLIVASPLLTVGTWYKIAASINGTAWIVYQAPQGSALTTNSGTRVAPVGMVRTYLGTDSDTSATWSNSAMADFKVYAAALTQTEIEAELAQFTPTRTANLVRYHPLHVAELADYSVNGNNFIAGTTNPTTITDPTEPTDITPYNPPTGMPPNNPVSVSSVAQPLMALGIVQDNF